MLDVRIVNSDKTTCFLMFFVECTWTVEIHTRRSTLLEISDKLKVNVCRIRYTVVNDLYQICRKRLNAVCYLTSVCLSGPILGFRFFLLSNFYRAACNADAVL